MYRRRLHHILVVAILVPMVLSAPTALAQGPAPSTGWTGVVGDWLQDRLEDLFGSWGGDGETPEPRRPERQVEDLTFVEGPIDPPNRWLSDSPPTPIVADDDGCEGEAHPTMDPGGHC